MSEYAKDWVDVDFRPAPAGWRVVLDDGMPDPADCLVELPMPGWLVQRLDQAPGDSRPGRRRIIASLVHDYEPMQLDLWEETCRADGLGLMLGVFGPGEVPSPSDVEEARAADARRAAGRSL